jgi:predicted enzyme related to lactoylglutathione lyase
MIDTSITRQKNKGHPMTDNTVRGRFVWHELVTPNGKGAHDFYTKAVGWKTQAWEHSPSYQMFAASSGPLGATVESRDGVPQWVAYIGTTDVDATVEKAKSLGATVTTEPTTLPNAGRYAVLNDPNGATFGVHGSSGETPPEKDPQYGEFCWHELATTVDPVQAFGFYRELFGWDDLDHYDMGPTDGTYLLFGRNGNQLGGMFNKGTIGKPGSAYWVGYVRTNDVDKMAEDVKAARGAVLSGPMDVPGGHRIAQFEDPHGAFFAGHVLAKDAKAAKPAKPATAKVAAAPKPAPAKAAVAPKPAKAVAAPKSAPAPKPAPAKPAAKAAAAKPQPKKAPKKKVAKKAAKKATKKVAKKVAKKKGASKAAKKGAKKTAKKVAKKTATKAKRPAAKKKSAGAKKKAKGKRR